MALVLGTSSGFVTVAPTTDPAGATATTIDGSSVVTKHTSPAGATRITEIGWYRGGTNTANWEIALYADDAGVAGARLFVDATNSSASSGWLTTAVDWTITPNTPYWLGLQMDAHTGSGTVQSEASGGAGMDLLATQTALNDPYGGGAVADADGMRAIYALVSIPKVLTADTVSFAFTGFDAGLSWQHSFTADSDSFAVTVADAEFALAHNLSVESGSFVLSGADIGFGALAPLTAEVGDFSLVGFDAEFALEHRFAAEQGTFTFTGADAELSSDGEVIVPPVVQQTSVGGGGLSWQDFVSAEFRRKHLSHLLDVEEKKLEKVEKKLKVVRKKLKSLKKEPNEGILANLQALEFKREKIENKIQALEVEMVPLELFLEAEIDEDDEEVMGIFH
jgi:hypothetical protein